MKHVHAVVLLALLSASALGSDDTLPGRQLAERRAVYVQWIADAFGELEPAMEARDGRRWALNQARLVLNRDLDRANGYFESFGPLPGGREWKVRTLLVFGVCDASMTPVWTELQCSIPW